MTVNLLVFVPAHNEVARLCGLLDALATQTYTGFACLVCDNASTDGTGEAALAWATHEPRPFPVVVQRRDSKSINDAWHSAFVFASEHGYTHVLRTDADCLPNAGWTAAARAAFAAGADVVLGSTVPRADENPSLVEKYVYPAATRAASLAGIYLNRSRAPVRYLTRYRYATGANMGLSLATWQAMPHPAPVQLRDAPEDLQWLNAARTITRAVVPVRRMRVQSSMRRFRSWGALRLLLWHWDRRWTPPPGQEDVR